MTVKITIERDPELIRELEALDARFEANWRYLDAIWHQALTEHPRQWVAVYGGDEKPEVVYADDLFEIIESVPDTERGAAEIRFLDPDPPILSL
jgi:hypothetical protein